jgi:tetratricopeptide (TPR) repeat protein
MCKSKGKGYWLGLGLVGVLLLSEAAIAMPQPSGEPLAQQPETAAPEGTRSAAERAFAQGMELYQQGTAESLQQAIEKWEVALPLWREVGDSPEERLRQRFQEALTLTWIGYAYNALGESHNALDYYQQALPIIQAVGDSVGEANILSNMGDVYDALGERRNALDYYQQALPIITSCGRSYSGSYHTQ